MSLCSRLRNSVENVLARVIAMATHQLFGYLTWLSKQLFVSSADDENLDRHGAEWNIYRHPAVQAYGIVAFSGVNGAVIETGTVLRRMDGAEYTLQEDVTIVTGTGSGAVLANDKGSTGNTAAGAKLSLVSPVAGIQTEAVINENGIVGGVDIESNDNYRVRILQRKQNPPQGGSKADYETWAKQVPGVTRAWIYPEQMGLGTVQVLFVMDNKEDTIIPSEPEVQTVLDYLDNVRPMTSHVFVTAPTVEPVDFEIALSPNTVAVQNAVQAELADLFHRESQPGGTLYLSRIREAISAAAGEFDHDLIQPAGNIEMAFGQIAVLGSFTWGAL